MDSNEKLIQSLVRREYLKTPLVIDAFRAVDRADFVLPADKKEAYEDTALPIGQGQTISQPSTVAFLLELLDPQPGERALDVGLGSGWTTAMLAHIVSQKEGGEVFAIERVPLLCEMGTKNIEGYGFIEKNVAHTFCQDATQGLPQFAPFDKILAGATASRAIPRNWRDQLNIGGRIVAPVGGSVWLFVKTGKQEWQEEEFPGFAFVPLIKESRIKNHESRKRISIGKMETNQQSDTNGKKYMNKEKKKRAWWKVLFVLFLIGLIFTLAIFAREVYAPHASYRDGKQVEIAQGMGLREIAAHLEREGVIRSQWAFVLYVAMRGDVTKLKPGTYEFSEMPISRIVDDLVAGGARTRVITIPEGWTVKDIRAYLVRENFFSEPIVSSFAIGTASPSIEERFPFLKDRPPGADLEGYLFPDTYHVWSDAKPDIVTGKMLENFGRKITPVLVSDIAKQKHTLHEVVVMASMIEKEVRSDDDRRLVSGILWKRLELGMPLQVDATIVYVKKQQLANPLPVTSAKITIEDTRIDSPYNTYKNRGLPFGPIANPGMSAILAAAYPTESPYLYYLSTPDGRTVFSKTMEEHNIAKAKYLQ